MSDKVQVGLRVDREVYERFKDQVRDRRGRWQGVGGDELENAMRHYLNFGSEKPLPDQFAEMNARLQRIEGAVGTAEADGSGPAPTPSDAESHTHTPPATPTEKPDSQASTEKKVRWLAARFEDESGTTKQHHRSDFVDLVKEEYAFRADTAKRYVQELIDHFDYVTHPRNDQVYMSRDERDRIERELQDSETEETDERIDEVSL